MYTIECTACGGKNEVEDGQKEFVCDWCGLKALVPKVLSRDQIRFYNRGNYFRRQGEFDKAITAFENLSAQNPDDCEAKWELLLARYGIEYVKDPATGKQVPTCHRVQQGSILTDDDYVGVLETAADDYERHLYEEKAKQIDQVQQGILSIVKTEDPSDVFICYKDSNGAGSRTEDSVLAQDIYDRLTKEGLRVFFSRITLEDKLGTQYEPYIYAALQSAKVMLLVAMSIDNVNAVWVKNEWSRFLQFRRDDSSKELIPCYKRIDPYDLPDELASFQGIDMAKVGAMQDLVHGVKKICAAAAKSVPEAGGTMGPVAASVEPLLERTANFLDEGNFAKAETYANRVLDMQPKNLRGNAYLVMAQNRKRTISELESVPDLLMNNKSFMRALDNASGDLKSELEKVRDAQTKRLYEELIAKDKAKPATTLSAVRQRAREFEAFGSYRDAKSHHSRLKGKEQTLLKEINRVTAQKQQLDEAIASLESDLEAKERSRNLAHGEQEGLKQQRYTTPESMQINDPEKGESLLLRGGCAVPSITVVVLGIGSCSIERSQGDSTQFKVTVLIIAIIIGVTFVALGIRKLMEDHEKKKSLEARNQDLDRQIEEHDEAIAKLDQEIPELEKEIEGRRTESSMLQADLDRLM